MSVEESAQSLAAARQLIDHVHSLEIGGGEPLLHRDLDQILHQYMQYEDWCDQLLIVTNGTILPSDHLAQALKACGDKMIIHISDYNIKPAITRQLITLLERLSIRYRVDCYHGDDQYQGGWIDPGAVACFNRSLDTLKQIYQNCGIVKNGGCWRIYRGKIHYCVRAMVCNNEGIDLPQDYVDLFDEHIAASERKQKLHRIAHADCLVSCDYCHGDLGTKDPRKRHPAAEQL